MVGKFSILKHVSLSGIFHKNLKVMAIAQILDNGSNIPQFLSLTHMQVHTAHSGS